MKKIISIISLFMMIMLSSCSIRNSSLSLYISSYHISYSDNEYHVSFYSPSSFDLAMGDSESTNSYSTFSSTNLLYPFNDVQNSVELDVNFHHVKSVILDPSFITDKNIKLLFDLIENTSFLDMNFYLFVSEEKASDIYQLENPDSSSTINSIINNPVSKDFLFLGANPIHLIEFARKYYDGNSVIRVPVIDVDEVWESEKSIKTLVSRRLYLVNSAIKEMFDSKEYQGYTLLKDNDYINLSINKILFTLSNYDVKYKRKNGKYVIKIKSKVRLINGYTISKIEELCHKEIDNVISLCYKKNIDIVNIKLYNYLYRTNFTSRDIKIDLDFNL